MESVVILYSEKLQRTGGGYVVIVRLASGKRSGSRLEVNEKS